MQYRIETLSEKKLLGLHVTMSLSANKTFELWQSFMKRRKEIQNHIGTDLYSLQIHDPSWFDTFDPCKEFEKWATTEVDSFEQVPEGMETMILPGGLYAVFLYKGDQRGAPEAFRYIFMDWLPGSGYELDHRPHFEILGGKYKNGDPSSEEEICIPIRIKSVI